MATAYCGLHDFTYATGKGCPQCVPPTEDAVGLSVAHDGDLPARERKETTSDPSGEIAISQHEPNDILVVAQLIDKALYDDRAGLPNVRVLARDYIRLRSEIASLRQEIETLTRKEADARQTVDAFVRRLDEEIKRCDMAEQRLLARETPAQTEVAACLDCGLPYTDFLLDVLLPRSQWLQIHPDENGLLCAACIVRRVSALPGVTALHAIADVRQVVRTCRTCVQLRPLKGDVFACPVANMRLHAVSVDQFGCIHHETAESARWPDDEPQVFPVTVSPAAREARPVDSASLMSDGETKEQTIDLLASSRDREQGIETLRPFLQHKPECAKLKVSAEACCPLCDEMLYINADRTSVFCRSPKHSTVLFWSISEFMGGVCTCGLDAALAALPRKEKS